MASKSVRLRVFAIKEPSNLTIDASSLDVLQSCFEKKPKVIDRCMLLSQGDPNKEKDLISFFTESSTPKNIFCTMLRIAPGEDAQHVTNDLLEKPTFTIEDLDHIYDQNNGEPPAVCKEHYYFAINNNHLVTNLRSGKTIKDLQTYLAWLMEDDLFELYPLTKTPDDISVKDISNVTFAGSTMMQHLNNSENSAPKNVAQASEKGTQQKIINLKNIAIKHLFDLIGDTKSMNEIDAGKYVSAKLILEIKKPSAKDKEHFQKTFGALLVSVAETENVVIKPRKGKSITGKDILEERSVNISLTTSGQLNEQELKQEMSKYLNEFTTNE